jgi:hypothetical protein
MTRANEGNHERAQGVVCKAPRYHMQRERQKRAGQDDRRGARRGNRRVAPPIVMAARRPRPEASVGAPATSEPAAEPTARVELAPVEAASSTVSAPPARRSARIVAVASPAADQARLQRERLLARFMASEGRAMISRAADECRRAGVEFPLEQGAQLQLLEHVDEALARDAIAALGRILSAEAPRKRPILEQRLRRLEDTADEEATRSAAAELRRALRA